MIDKLHIKNFLAFPELVVPELKLINLVAGKNTAGKTALLQSLQILYDSDKNHTLGKILASRNTDIWGLYNEVADLNEAHLTINDIDNYWGRWNKVSDDLEREQLIVDRQKKTAQYVSPVSQYDRMVKLWGQIALTSKELEILKIVNLALGVNIQRISVLDTSIKVLLKGAEKPVQIESLGDGAKRLLLVGLSIVESKDGLLLIDEIETHLHHSVIRKLWNIILEYAVKWNIQVVATTHSQDAIRELYYEIAANEEYQDLTQVLRLQIGRSGKHEVIQYPYNRLEFVMDSKMEIRGN